jgi:hypothetical protein
MISTVRRLAGLRAGLAEHTRAPRARVRSTTRWSCGGPRAA